MLRRAFGSLHLPGAAVVRWLDEHVQLRLSILLGWLFGRSVFFVQLLRWMGSMARYMRVLAQPVVELLGAMQSFFMRRVEDSCWTLCRLEGAPRTVLDAMHNMNTSCALMIKSFAPAQGLSSATTW